MIVEFFNFTYVKLIINVYLLIVIQIQPNYIILGSYHNNSLALAKNYKFRLAIKITHKIKMRLYFHIYEIESPDLTVICHDQLINILGIEFNVTCN